MNSTSGDVGGTETDDGTPTEPAADAADTVTDTDDTTAVTVAPVAATAEPIGVVEIDEGAVPVAAAPTVTIPAGGVAPVAEDEDTENDLIQIDDEEVPLAVVEDDEPVDLDEEPTELVDVEDEDVPLAMPTVEEAGRLWWSWIPVIGAVASAVESYREKKKEKEESGDDGHKE